MSAPRPRLLLVGAGHTHLHLLRQSRALHDAGYLVTLLAPPVFRYSGVASATATGDLPESEGSIDVAALAASAGVTYEAGRLVALDQEARVARTDDGCELGYDVVSFNIGSVVDPDAMSVEDAVVRVKPLDGLLGLQERLRSTPAARVSVVGAGASGIELAAHLAALPMVEVVQLVEGGSLLGPDLPRGARRRLRRLLTSRGVELRTGAPVTHLGARGLTCADGTELRHDLAVLATGLAAPKLIADLGLGDRAGIPVRATLQHVDHDDLYAAGDCADFLPGRLPRIGVHGVRQGPVLLASLLARRTGAGLPTYDPQRRVLSIIDLGAGTALATWGPLWWQGPAALRLKRRIDRRWVTASRSL